VAGFERFIAWTHEQRSAGQYACFAVVPRGSETAIGIFQLRALDPGFGTAEWGFVIGSPYWGSGAFADGASVLLAFAFDQVGVTRLEARASVHNGRGNGALRKVGAVEECRLRQSFVKNGERHDQVLWALLASEWRARLTRPPATLLRRAHGIH
jgi:RimJ/RimL family protein N-acetyltransferase